MRALGNSQRARGRRFLGDSRGAVAAVVAVSATVLAGVIGLGIEVSSWYMATRKLQAAADAAAIAAAFEHYKGNDAAIPTAAVKEAQRHNFHGASCSYQSAGTDCSIYNPPRSGAFAADDTAFEVVISEPLTRGFSRLFTTDEIRISSRAVAHAETGGGSGGCILALDTSASQTLQVTGNATITAPECTIYSNSTHATQAVKVNGNITITAEAVQTPGGISKTGNVHINAEEKPNSSAAPDPYAAIPVPDFSTTCTHTGYSLSGNNVETLNPGTYCNGISLSGNSKVTLNAGTYVIAGGNLSLTGNNWFKAASGARVTIVLTSHPSNPGWGYARVQFTGNTQVSLTAQTQEDLDGTDFEQMAGFVFYQDRNAPSSGTNQFTGNNSTYLTGALYFPNQNLSFVGNSSSGSSGCTQIIARKISLVGNAGVGTNCEDVDVKPIGTSVKIKLIE